ncbi:GIY-YIG nuclease family protein [Paenibacillus cremeus]|uniref:GIY-YIG nuclease family protein n=1 Tax=Paenibacillus cremeus TaxID=2163881 RepID=A0A559JNM6_9BACL|nr:GIY-YIG nuclease family protein [Paenibacillus cremeus]TVY01492.1 GIY-YIG nuclease family protein [Paenibacillus cremeus]
MSINNTTYTYNEIVNKVAPKKFKELLQSPTYLVSHFGVKFKGVASIIKQLKLPFESDFKGLYVFYENDKAIYVGISKNVLKRLRQHVKCEKQSESSFAYLLTLEHAKQNNITIPVGTREERMNSKEFYELFNSTVRARLLDMKVKFIEINCDVSLYLSEVYFAMELNTDKFNSFETH